MASLQAHIAVWVLKLKFKPALARAEGNAARVRKLMTPAPYRIPQGVTIAPAQVGGVLGEWVESSLSSGVTMLYLHGGGYVACSAETHRPITVAFAQQGFRVFAPNYRLAPENPFPAAVDDAVAVSSALRPAVIAGDSAGGGLALALLLAIRDRGGTLPAAAAVFSPWTDLAATGESIRRNDRRCAMFLGANIALGARLYLGGADPRTPLASPLYGDLAGLPPLLIHAGADEVLVDDSTRLAERARTAGVTVDLKVWPVVPHCWQLILPTMPESRESMSEATAFLMRHAKVAAPLPAGTRI
ncbi:MAG TPA: alpha/beta hydrolase [Bryobacteraceae bacterium]|nr:alpha/beta hydrolase [Bryobacteraceae bacterium]